MAMVGLDEAESVAENCRRFACLEASGRSATYEALALAVADDSDLLAFLARLPTGKRQPNLLFAGARHLLGKVPDFGSLRALATSRADELSTVMLQRRTQTNEQGRCATLLPALALFEGPLAIVEVGASAGLCLNIDQYSYDYGIREIPDTDPQAPILRRSVLGGAPKLAMPEVAWAAGIDLNPLGPAKSDDRSWLECLVWPDQPERAARLSAALDTARRNPTPIHSGDLVEQLPGVLEQAPPDATPVVFHSAVSRLRGRRRARAVCRPHARPRRDLVGQRGARSCGQCRSTDLQHRAVRPHPESPAGCIHPSPRRLDRLTLHESAAFRAHPSGAARPC